MKEPICLCVADPRDRLSTRGKLRAGGIEYRKQRGISALGIVWDLHGFIAQSKIDRQIGTELPVVLNIRAVDRRPGFDWGNLTRQIRREFASQILQESVHS